MLLELVNYSLPPCCQGVVVENVISLYNPRRLSVATSPTREDLPVTITYPGHLLETQRIFMAQDLLVRLISQRFPFINRDTILEHVRCRGAGNLMDFWNALFAEASYIKLTALPEFISDESCTWDDEDAMSLTSLTFFSIPEQLVGYPIENPASLDSVRSYLLAHPEAKEGLLRRCNALFTPYEPDRRVFVRHHKGCIGIDDGNHHCLHALLLDETTVRTYIASPAVDGRPQNLWVPTWELMRLVRMGRQSPWKLLIARAQLADYFSRSKAAKIVYRERIVGDKMRGAKVVGWGMY